MFKEGNHIINLWSSAYWFAIYLKNIHWANKDKPFVIAGIPTNFVENVTFDNCYLAGKLLAGSNDGDFQMELKMQYKTWFLKFNNN